jgi:hypothetical protein
VLFDTSSDMSFFSSHFSSEFWLLLAENHISVRAIVALLFHMMKHPEFDVSSGASLGFLNDLIEYMCK